MKLNRIGTFLFCVICLLFAVFSSGCATTDNSDKTHSDLITHFGKHGIKIDSAAPLMYQLAQAESGFTFKIGKREVGIYKYNLQRKKQQHRYQLIEDSGVLYINGTKFKARINGAFVMIDYDTHPDEKKIVEAFDSF